MTITDCRADLEILAFPRNQFGSQEPGTDKHILEFACTRFKAGYPASAKVDVNGKNADPLQISLKASKRGFFGDGIKWNFSKFLVDKEGNVVNLLQQIHPSFENVKKMPRIV